jgi:hypothetical protein
MNMEAETLTPLITQRQSPPKAHQYPPIGQETRTHVNTQQAAHYLLRRPQTLRDWACRSGSGPLTPRRMNGRLHWAVADIKELMGVA